MDIKGFTADEARRLVEAAHEIRPDEPRLAVGDDAFERLGALRRLLLLPEASIGSTNLGLRLFENPGDEAASRAIAAVEAIDFLSSWADDPGGAGLTVSEAVDSTLRRAGATP